MEQPLVLSEVEGIKERSRYLRGTIRESLADETTGALRPEDQHLIKFHGAYQQRDRSAGPEAPVVFMVRARVPAGILSTDQWLALDALSDAYGIGDLRLTTRQTIEWHGIPKRSLKDIISRINAAGLDTLAASGDVNRNVMAPGPRLTRAHGEVGDVARAIHARLTPHTSAYHELWIMDGQKTGSPVKDHEPLYGKTYLPRKFKIALAIPPANDTDVFTNDLGLVAIVHRGDVTGFNVIAGGGLGFTFGVAATFPRLGTVIGYVPKERVVDLCEKIVLIQRDHGNRSNRKLARLKYTMEQMTLHGFRAELEKRFGGPLEKARPALLTTSGDRFGWQQGEDGKWHLTLFVEGGRVKDVPGYALKTGLRAIAASYRGEFMLTANHNLVISGLSEAGKGEVKKHLDQHGITARQEVTAARANTLACVALPLCPLALTEAERYLPLLMDKLDKIIIDLGLQAVPITVRMTGCPNGCARPALGEIALIGRARNVYNLYLGASHQGDRLNTLYREKLGEEDILAVLKEVLTRFAHERLKQEYFGDYVHRIGYLETRAEGDERRTHG